MHTHGRGITCALAFLFLSACHSDRSSLEFQINEELNQLLNSAAHKQQLSQQLSSSPPDSRMLNEAHVKMYVLVKARAMQLPGVKANNTAIDTTNATAQITSVVNGNDQPLIQAAESIDNPLLAVDSEPELSPQEQTALNELELNQDLYVWVKYTIDDTVAFIDATIDPAIIDAVTFHDPVIKHNITMVKNYQERLRFANSDSLKVSSLFHKPDSARSDLSREKFA